MRKTISLFAITFVLIISSFEPSFAYRSWFDRIVNGKIVDTECFGYDGNCLPEVEVTE